MNKRLGRGLDALIPSLEIDEKEQIKDVELSRIRPNPYQPRKQFHEEQLAELMASIKEHGVIQPIIVRESLNSYEIVAGERRWRASKKLGLKTIPVVIKKFNDQQVMEIALIENLQREDLNPVEIATAYSKLMELFHLTQEELAAKLGKSRPNVANYIRLLQLPEIILKEVSNGALSMGHARSLITLENEKDQLYFLNKAIREQWSVRTLEDKLKDFKQDVSRETTKVKKKETEDIMLKHIEDRLRNRFKTSVRIKTGKSKGKIEIEYFDQKDLERILEMFDIQS